MEKMFVYLVATVSQNKTTETVELNLLSNWFQMHTKNGSVIMGRKTWDLLGPLPNCKNIIVSRSYHADDANPNIEWCTSLTEAMNITGTRSVYIIGGSEMFHSALLLDLVDACILTHVDVTIDSGVTVPLNRKIVWKHGPFEISLLPKKESPDSLVSVSKESPDSDHSD